MSPRRALRPRPRGPRPQPAHGPKSPKGPGPGPNPCRRWRWNPGAQRPLPTFSVSGVNIAFLPIEQYQSTLTIYRNIRQPSTPTGSQGRQLNPYRQPAREGCSSALVPEVAANGGGHPHACGGDGRADVPVAHRAAGLDDRADARVDRELRAVGEGEEGVGGERRPGEQ